MKNIYIAKVTCSISSTNSFGEQKLSEDVEVVPVWASDLEEAEDLVKAHYNEDDRDPGNWVRVTDILLKSALGTPGR